VPDYGGTLDLLTEKIELRELLGLTAGDVWAQEGVRTPDPTPYADDVEIIDGLRNDKNGTKFAAVFDIGDSESLSAKRDDPSPSGADASLISIIRFRTQDPDQIERIMRQSGLVRDKWDTPRNGTTFLRYSIERILARGGPVYEPGLLSQARKAQPAFHVVEAEEVERETDESSDLPPEVSPSGDARTQAPASERWPSMRADELRERDLPPVEHLTMLGQEGYFVKGESHVLAAFPKTGKTVLTLASVLEWLAADDTQVCIYFSEESPRMWARRLKKLDDTTGLDRLYFVAARGMGAQNMINRLDTDYPDGALEHRGIIVIDTLRLLGIEEENDSAQMERAVSPWTEYQQTLTCTLLINHHTRKGGGRHGEGVSGGHGLIGAVDTVLELHRDDNVDNWRIIKVVGTRSLEEISGIYERVETSDILGTTHELRYVGEKKDVTRDETTERIWEALTDTWQTSAQIGDALNDPQPSKWTLNRDLQKLGNEGRALRQPPMGEVISSGQKLRWRLA